MIDLERSSSAKQAVAFGPFLLDPPAGRLWRDRTAVALRPKAFDVLCYLTERPGVLVSADELFERVWHGVAVTPQSLINVIAQLRAALGDDARRPCWLETVRGRGYRFTAEPRVAASPRAAPPDHPPVVGREAHLAVLAAAWQRAQGGRSETVLLVGEPGIGKTTVAEAFLRSLEGAKAEGRVLVSRGHCVEQHGVHEPYLPVLSAVDELATGAHRDAVEPLLRRLAPTWLLQIPGLVRARERVRLEREVLGATATRMLREGARLFEAVARQMPTVLLLEDLHWADASTLDLVAFLARRGGAVPLLIVCTSRPSASPSGREGETLAERLAGDRTAVRALEPLDAASIRTYLEIRLGDHARAAALAPRVEARCAGNPLFLRSLVDEIAAEGTPDLPTPRALRAMIDRRLEALDPVRRMLVETASVFGLGFSATELAGALERSPEEVDSELHALARCGRLIVCREDAAARSEPESSGYGFVHAAHRLVVYEGIAPLRRRSLHRRAGEALERIASARRASAATQLARHFEAAGVLDKAIAYWRQSAAAAMGRFSHRESAAALEEALRLIRQAPGAPPMQAAEVQVLFQLGSVLALAEGYASPRAREAFARAGELLEGGQGQLAEKLGVEMLLTFGELTAARWRDARARAGRLLEFVESLAVPGLLPIACCWLAFPLSALGELAAARAVLERGAAIEPFPGMPLYFDIHRMIDAQRALVAIALGDLEEGRRLRDLTLERSRRSGTQLELAHTALWATEAAVLADDRAAGPRIAALSVEVSERNGFPRYLAQSRLYRAWLDSAREPRQRLATMQAMLDERRSFGDRFRESVALGLIAQVQAQAGDDAGAAATLAEALEFADATGERDYEVELLRLEGERLLRGASDRGAGARLAAPRSAVQAAEDCFRRALALAREQRSRHWGRRVVRSLDHLLARQAGRAAERRVLAELARELEAEG